MKKISFIVALVLGSAVAMAQNGRIQLRSESRAEITKSEFKTIRAIFSYGSIESIEVPTGMGTFSEIALPGTYPSGEIGTPELPATHELLAVPFGATPSVTILNYTTTDYDLSEYGINTIVPHQNSVRKDQRPEDIEFAYNADAYQTRSLATVPQANIELEGTMRGIRIGSLLINPLSYNAATNTLRVFNDIEVEINFDGADYAETERMLVNTYSPYFDVVYKQMFNYRQINDVYTDHPDLMAYPVHMIVVTPQNYLSALEPWTNWKIQKGFDVNVVTTSQTGSNYNNIKSYITNLYNTGVQTGATPTFLILVGDVAQIPNITGSQSQKVTDLYYGSVDGDDFPDMFYSRMSAETTDQLTAIINKILMYEQYTMPDPSYLNNVTLIAGWDSSWNPRVAQPTINYATTYYYNAAHGFNQVHTHLNQSQYNGCYNALSTGIGFVNYTAHGAETYWHEPRFSVSNVNQLTNTNKYFLAMGNCCLAANFGYNQPCFGEAMIRAENKGAFSYIGSCPSSYWYEDYYFAVGATNTFSSTPNINNTSTGCYDGIWMDDTYNTVSSMVFLGNLAVCYAHAGNYQYSVSNKYYWQSYHVLGDGSIMPYRVQPSANFVNHAQTYPANASSFTVSAEAGSYVGISRNNVLLGAALVPSSGTVNVPVTPITSGQVKIVVTKPQRQPCIRTINVGGGGSTFIISTSANPTNGGTTTGGGSFNQGQSCTVTATANSGFNFINWTENGQVVSTNASYTFSVNGDRSLVANFSDTEYTISTTSSPSEGGITNGGGFYTYGQSCTVTATANNGYSFTNWTENGNVVSTNASFSFTVTGNRYLIANFTAIPTYTIHTSSNPTIGGNTSGGGTFRQGQSCTVHATANSNYTFSNWTENGNAVSTNANYTFNVNNNRNLVANFTVNEYTVNAIASPSNGGSITGSGNYHYGETCTLTATPNPGYNFVKWTRSGIEVTTDPSFSFTVTNNITYTAHFETITYTVTIDADPSEGGTVSGGGIFSYGQTCIVAAQTNEHYNFVAWMENDEIASTDAIYMFSVTESRQLTANFEIESFEIIATSDPEEGANIIGAGIYNYGETVTLDVEPNLYYTFINWTENGTIVSEEPNYTFIAEASRNLVAHFNFFDGVNELNSNVLVYPNPVSEVFNVETVESINILEIYNMAGIKVHNMTNCGNKAEIEMGDMPNGIYFIQITTDTSIKTIKLIKE